MKRIWKILILVVVVGIAVTAWLSVVHYRAKAAVSAYREQLKQRGEKLTIAELTPVLSADEVTGGQELLATTNAMVKLTNAPPMMRWLAPGHALVGWAEAISPTDNTTNCWSELAEVLNKHPEAVEQLAAALQRPRIGFSVQYQLGWSSPMMVHPEVVREAGFWLAQCMMLALHEGDTNRAWNCLLLETASIAKYRGEPLVWSQLRRNGMVELAVVATWEALQYPGWDENHLAQLQTNWASLDLAAQTEGALSMDGAAISMMIAESRDPTNFNSMGGSKELNIDNLLVHPKDEISDYFEPRLAYRAWKWRESYHVDLGEMRMTQAALEMVRTARSNDTLVPAQREFSQKISQMTTNYSARENQFIKDWGSADGFSDYLGSCAEVETERRMVTTVLALKRYRLRHGEYPTRLEELTPDLLAKVPIDFMDGKPLRYRREDDGTFLLYSVGPDGRDDGGDASPLPTTSSAYRRWEHMRDIVWPAPATAEEVKKYETEMFQKNFAKQAVKAGRVLPPRLVPAPAGTNSNTN